MEPAKYDDVKRLLGSVERIPTVQCVYILFQGNTLWYIGQTKNGMQRLIYHSTRSRRGGGPSLGFSSGVFIEITNKCDRLAVEGSLIAALWPKMNSCCLTCQDRIKKVEKNATTLRRYGIDPIQLIEVIRSCYDEQIRSCCDEQRQP